MHALYAFKFYYSSRTLFVPWGVKKVGEKGQQHHWLAIEALWNPPLGRQLGTSTIRWLER